MPRRRRVFVEGLICHVYNQAGRGEAPFKLEDEARRFWRLLHEVKKLGCAGGAGVGGGAGGGAVGRGRPGARGRAGREPRTGEPLGPSGSTPAGGRAGVRASTCRARSEAGWEL